MESQTCLDQGGGGGGAKLRQMVKQVPVYDEIQPPRTE